MLFSKIIEKKFDAVLGRYDGDPLQYYLSPADYPAIKQENFNVQGDRGVTLRGYFYYYGEPDTGKFIIFDHGIGAGHYAYFAEIEYLARNGYTVYSYDHAGCVESGGEGILGFAEGINDLDHVIRALKEDGRFGKNGFKIMGHSYGGYSAMNVTALYPEVSHVVSLAGFLSARSLIEQYIPKMFLKYSEEVMERERKNNPVYADMNAIDSLKKSDAKLLHIQSEDDEKVKFELCTKLLKEGLKGRAGTEYIVVNNRNHEPEHTVRAVKKEMAMIADEEKLLKKKKSFSDADKKEFQESYNWKEFKEEDEEIWKHIFDFLDK